MSFKNFNIYSYSEVVRIHIQFWLCVRVLVDLRISGNNCITALPSEGLPSWSCAFRSASSQLFFFLPEITALSNSIHTQNLFPSISRFYNIISAGFLYLHAGHWATCSRKLRRFVLPQINIPCFVDNYGRPAPFWIGTEMRMGARGETGGGNWRIKGRGNYNWYVK